MSSQLRSAAVSVTETVRNVKHFNTTWTTLKKTINQNDKRPTLAFMSGMHHICMNVVSITVKAEVTKMIANYNVTVKDVCCRNDSSCHLEFSHRNATLFVENITFVDYSIGVSSR